jgi:hypothetical protein
MVAGVGGERGGSLPHGEKWGEGGGSFGHRLLLWGGKVSAQWSCASATTHRRQTGLAGMQRGEAVPCLGWLRALRGRFKPTQTLFN